MNRTTGASSVMSNGSRRSPSPSGGKVFGASSSTFDFNSSQLGKKHAAAQAAAISDPTPVRRQFLEAEVSIHNNGQRRDLGEEGPPGPSPDTILHEAQLPPHMQYHHQHAPSSPSSMTGGGGGGGSSGSPTRGQRPPQSMTPSMMTGTSKSVPARSRALQGAVSQANNQQQRPGSVATSGRPGSASSSSAGYNGSSVRGGTPSGGPVVASFEEELTEISKLHERARQQQQGGPGGKGGRSGSSLGGSGKGAAPYGSTSLPSVDGLDEPFNGGGDLDPDAAGGSSANTATGKPIHVPYTPDLRAKLSSGTAVHSHVTPKPMVLRDFEMLAEACQRAGRARMEGHAYYKIGETYAKNKDTLQKSVTYFKRYLNICRRLNDLQGESKALNCLGIVYHELGAIVASSGGSNAKEGSLNNYNIAMEYHKQHADIADAAGVFIANTNMGLLYAILQNLQASLECHKQALQYAVRAGDKSAESLALANLGQSGAKQGDIATARVCVERHLELATTLHDTDASSEAYEQLGILASQRHDFVSASENFLLALDIAVRDNNQDRAKQLRCQVGFAQGMIRMEEQMKHVATGMGNTPEPHAV